jgi:hypothetical protein
LGNGETGARRSGAGFETHASPRPSASAGESREVDRSASGAKAGGVRIALTERGHERLTRFLIGKSVVETILLVALVAAFSYAHFNPRLRGALDAADERGVSGWALDESDPSRRVEVELYIDDHFVARRPADARRDDLLSAGRAADPFHGFAFGTPPLPARPAPYEARVFAVHEGADRERVGMQKIGKSIWFEVRPGEKSGAAPEKWWEGLEKR